MEADGRYTLFHERDRFEEQSLRFSLAWDPGVEERGMRLRLGPSWGASAFGGGLIDDVGTLWTGTHFGAARPRLGWRPTSYDAELGYGLLTRRGLPLSVFGVVSAYGEGAPSYRLGAKAPVFDRYGLSLDLEFLCLPSYGGGGPNCGVRFGLGRALGARTPRSPSSTGRETALGPGR